MQLFFLPFVKTMAQNIPFDRKNQLLQSIVIQIFYTSARQVNGTAKTVKTIIQIYSATNIAFRCGTTLTKRALKKPL
jgi:hypothetical protein